MILIHNTKPETAEKIITTGKLLANVEAHRKYNHLGGPFFYIKGQNGTEVPSGGKNHPVSLSFSCELPTIKKPRAEINRLINSGDLATLRGHAVIYLNDVSPDLIEQAIIVPDELACLTLESVTPDRAEVKPNRLQGLLGARGDHVGPYDVLLPPWAAR